MTIEDALVLIFAPKAQVPIGAGILVERNLVLTCAHVVNVALGRAESETWRPTGKVSVGFLDAPSLSLKASVDQEDDAWIPPSSTQPGADLCLLRLTSNAPAEVKIAK